jgi:hypothetical protein
MAVDTIIMAAAIMSSESLGDAGSEPLGRPAAIGRAGLPGSLPLARASEAGGPESAHCPVQVLSNSIMFKLP